MQWTRTAVSVNEELSLDLLEFSNLARQFQEKVKIDFTRGHFRVKTAESREEILEILGLRHEIFKGEFMGGEKVGVGLDIDAYDSVADHLCIVDLRVPKIVGTYRLLSSDFTQTFYSENEFKLSEFMSLPDKKLELGRACVHKEYRNGLVIALLWKGIAEYLKKSESRYLFGCASVKTMDVAETLLLHKDLLDTGLANDRYSVRPTDEYMIHAYDVQIRKLTMRSGNSDSANARAKLPPLFAAYMKAGARVHGYPALDVAFECVDFFTVLDTLLLPASYRERFIERD